MSETSVSEMEDPDDPPDLNRAVQACINDQADLGSVGPDASRDLVASVTAILNVRKPPV